MLYHFIAFFDKFISIFLNLIKCLFILIFGNTFIFFKFFDMIICILSNVADSNLCLFTHRFCIFSNFFSLLLRHRREKEFNALTIAVWIHTDICLLYRFFNIFYKWLLPRSNDNSCRILRNN